MRRIKSMMLRGVLAIALAAHAGACTATPKTGSFGGIAGGLVGEAASPTTIYVARDIVTMDPAKPHARALAIRDGRFVAVGTRSEVEAAAGADSRIDTTFADKVVIAGFVEQHVHPVLAALTMNTRVISIEDWDAIDGFSPAVRDEQNYQRRLKEALATHTDRTKPFITWGYHHYFHGDMSRAQLDRLAPDLPVIVWHRSGHEFFLNTKALELTGIDRRFIDGLTTSQKAQLSLEKGHFFEQGGLAILDKVTPFLASPDQFRRGLEFTERYYHRNGITLACEPGGFVSKPLQDTINVVYGDDATPFDHCFIADGKTFAARHPGDAKALIADTKQVLSWGQGRTWYLPGQVKLFTDGAIFSQLMMMKDGYTDGHHGEWLMDPPLFDHAFQAYWDAGYQIHVHNNGDEGLGVLLASLEKAMKRSPRKDHRTVLVHFGFATPEQVARWIELGGLVSANPYYVTALAGRYAKLGIGPERSENMVPLGDVVKHRGSLSFHSDMPMAPANPLLLVWAGVNRLTAEGDVVGPQQRVSLDTALRAVTIDAAYSIRQEDEVGSIEPGKQANLTILEQNPYEVPAAEIRNIPVWGTMLEGRIQPAPPANRAAASMRSAGARASVTGDVIPPAPAPAHAAGDGDVAHAAAGQLATLMSHDHGP